MPYPRWLVLLLSVCLLFVGCTPPVGQSPAAQPPSPLGDAPTEAPPTPDTTVITTDASGSAAIHHFVWQGDTLIAQFATGQLHDRLLFSPATELWQREQIALSALQVGATVRLYGRVDASIAYVDAVVVHSTAGNDFAPVISDPQAIIATGEIESFVANPNNTFTMQIKDNPLVITIDLVTRLFTEKPATLDSLEEESHIDYRGRLSTTADSALIEVTQAVILEKPSQYQATAYPLVCTDHDGFAQCRDKYLGLDFVHPSRWGVGVGQVTPSRYTGYSYNYLFGDQEIIAGGRSNPFAEPRGGMLTDFSGFGGQSAEQFCTNHYAALCEVVQPGVVLLVQLPTAATACNPAPGVIWEPLASVAVDLPSHATINGLLFATAFLSEALIQELAPIQPDPYANPPHHCDEAGQHRFDKRMQQLAQQIRDGTVDAQTQANLEALRTMAGSFQGEPLPKE